MYVFLAILPAVIILVIYMYLNPALNNKDFDLEYNISTGKKKYDEERNDRYSSNEYRFTHIAYCDEINGKKLIIHSLDKDISGKERVVFVVNDIKGKYPSAVIDYLTQNNNFTLFTIRYVGDSILIWNKRS